MADSSSSSASSYIHTVHHLIEECILFNMNKEECMDALAKHANILPLITSTVWKELEKENKEFFESYLSPSNTKMRGLIKEKSAAALSDHDIEITRQRIHKMLRELDSTANKTESG